MSPKHVLAGLLALSVACDEKSSSSSGKDEDKSGDSTASAKPKGEAWSSKEGGYSVVFPLGKPKVSSKSDPKGISWNDASSEIGAYSVQFADFEDSSKAQAYITNFMETMKAEIKEDKEYVLGAHKGREIKMIVSPTATMWMRLVAVEKRVYKIAAGTKNDRDKAFNFLDTFKLDK